MYSTHTHSGTCVAEEEEEEDILLNDSVVYIQCIGNSYFGILGNAYIVYAYVYGYFLFSHPSSGQDVNT